MRLEPPVEVKREKMEIDVREIEPILQAPAMELKPWSEAMMTLKDGKVLYIRQAKEEDVPKMLGYMEKIMKVQHDFYDIVGVRTYAEILGWYRKRLKDPFQLIGTIDGEWAGFANGRIVSEDVALSLHTLTFIRGARLGWAMYYAKTYYVLEMLKIGEWWSTFESYNGWRMAGLQMAQPSYPWPEYQHELGGARVFYVDQSYWNSTIKNYARDMVGSDLIFDVPNDIKEKNKEFRVPESINV